MPSTEPITDRGTDCFIKFESRADYNHFVAQLRLQLRSYLISSCEENKVEVGGEVFRTVESILMDVFMKYTLEFIRENLLVEGRPLSPPPETSGDSSIRQSGNTGGHKASHRTSNHRSEMNGKQPTTKPCDTALNERVIRQQYALYDAAVGNTRKRKDFAAYILDQVENTSDAAAEKLKSQLIDVEQLEADRLSQVSTDPRQRWDVLNAEIPNVQRTQDGFTCSNQIISKLMQSLPQLIERASRAIELHEEVINTLKPIQ